MKKKKRLPSRSRTKQEQSVVSIKLQQSACIWQNIARDRGDFTYMGKVLWQFIIRVKRTITEKHTPGREREKSSVKNDFSGKIKTRSLDFSLNWHTKRRRWEWTFPKRKYTHTCNTHCRKIGKICSNVCERTREDRTCDAIFPPSSQLDFRASAWITIVVSMYCSRGLDDGQESCTKQQEFSSVSKRRGAGRRVRFDLDKIHSWVDPSMQNNYIWLHASWQYFKTWK